MPEQQGQPPAVDLSFLDTDPALIDDANWYQPLTQAQVAALLTEAARSADDERRVSRIQIRLTRAIRGAPCPCPVLEREMALQRLFTGRFREGAAPGLVAELCRLMAAGPAADAPAEQRFTALDSIPSQDDPELTTLMEAVRRLPRDRGDTVIESMLRCALGYERTGNPEFLTRLAGGTLVTFRTGTDPENRAAPGVIPMSDPARD
ncbi:MAG TPA: hypothetical protein VIZ43_02360 [Trebonia sp.]